MSGIMGIYYPDHKPVESNYLRGMLDILEHRGSDRADIWCQDAVGLGHRMLWTTPESLTEKLPYCDHLRGLTITADARIDNRQELISWLGLGEQTTPEITDSQIILEAYQKWGQDCPQKLLGDFAFAIWDQRQQQLFCVRDCFGIKPFYYYYSEQVFTFASEIKALFCLPEVPRQINELRVAHHLISNLDDKKGTFYQDIFRLPPAHSLTVTPDKIAIEKYWSLNPETELLLGSQQEYAEAYQELFKQAVASRLRSHAPVGSMLSGGLDSSSICCTARDLLQNTNQKLQTFSGIFPGLPESDRKYADERFYMDKVLDTGGFVSHQIRGDTLSPLYKQKEIFDQVDEPYMGPNYYLNWAIYEEAQRQGVRVLLDGIDGDSTVSHGFERFAELARHGKWRTVVREAKQYSQKMKQHNVSLSLTSIIWQLAISPLIPDSWGHFWQQLKGSNPWYDASLINPDFARRLDLKQQIYQLSQKDVPLSNAREYHWHAMNEGIHAYVLELADKGNSTFGIEPRYPFFDRRLVEFCLSVPIEHKFRHGWTRYLARIGMNGILPQAIQSRVSKADVGRNFRRKLIHEEQPTLDLLVADTQQIAPYVDLAKLKASYQKCQSHQGSDDDIFCIYTTLNLSLWLGQFA